MDTDAEKMHLQSVEEYVLDEDKIVTYCWLSKVLSIHVNLSKELLSKFASDPSHESSVYVTYLVSGKLKDGSYNISVVGQDKIDETNEEFENISSQHVYSVQKKKEMPSADLLYMVNREKVDIHVSQEIGAIKCSASVQRSGEEIAKLRSLSLSKVESSSHVALAKTPLQSAESSTKADAENSKKENETKEEASTSGKSAGKGKPSSIAAMFAAQSTKSSSSSANSQSKAKQHPKKAAGINSFFSKVPKTESPPSDKKDKPVEKNDEDEPMEVDVPAKKVEKQSPKPCEKERKKEEVRSPQSDRTIQTEVTSSKPNAKPPKTKVKSKPRKAAPKEKQRKRIKMADPESSEDDMFGEEKESSPEPDSRDSPPPPPSRKIEDSDDEVIPPTPQPEVGKKNRRKRKVVKDRNYLDDEGYMVTEKVTIMESCSDSDDGNKDNSKKLKENPAPAKTSNNNDSSYSVAKENNKSATNVKESKRVVKKTVSPSKNKQSSLMSFFKKV